MLAKIARLFADFRRWRVAQFRRGLRQPPAWVPTLPAAQDEGRAESGAVAVEVGPATPASERRTNGSEGSLLR
jgi:hypothetical protein